MIIFWSLEIEFLLYLNLSRNSVNFVHPINFCGN